MMIVKATLNTLLSNMDKIEKRANIHGFKNMALFKPLFFADSNKLNFAAVPAPEWSLNFFHLDDMEFESELSMILNCSILFFPENRINREFESYILKNKILLTEDNAEKITSFFSDILEVRECNITQKSSEKWDDIIFNDQSACSTYPDTFPAQQHKHP